LLAGTTFSGGSYSANTWTSTNANRAVGQVNVADSTSNDFYLTGVQLEVGDTATDFEHRTFDDERERCERYFQKWDVEAAVGAGLWYTVSIVLAHLNFRKIMRTSPTMSVSSADFVKAYRPNASIDSASGTNFDVININSARFNLTMASNGTAGEGAMVQVRPSEYIHADAEL
jgi:hypothetical protein